MTITSDQLEIDLGPSPRSAVAWPAVIAGALAAAAISLILLVLGSGLGLSVISPWSNVGASAATVAAGSVIWLIVVQWIASATGGYMAGRLRIRSIDAPDEVFFRDTANGFLAWALATLLVAGLLTSALSAIVGAGAQVASTVASGVAQGAGQAAGSVAGAMNPEAYFVDTLYRQAPASPAAAMATSTPAAASTTVPGDATGMAVTPSAPATESAASRSDAMRANTTEMRAETGRILANGLAGADFPAADSDYLAQLVSSNTGLSGDEAKARVADVVQKMQAAKAQALSAADAARKAATRLALYMFLSLLVGAFIASAAAALGGGHRDEVSSSG